MSYLGGDLVLITSLNKEKANEFAKFEDDNFLSIFTSIEILRDNMVTTNRLMWLRCIGIPLSAWGRIALHN